MQIVLKQVEGSPLPCDSKSSDHRQIHDLMREHDSLCYYCEVECVIVCRDLPPEFRRSNMNMQLPNLATRDHLLPKSHGGGSKHLVLACFKCNNMLGNMSVKDRAKYIMFGDMK